MGFGLVLVAIGGVLLVWPAAFVWWVGLYRSGSVLSVNAPVRHTPPRHKTERLGRAVGLALLVGGLVLAFAM